MVRKIKGILWCAALIAALNACTPKDEYVEPIKIKHAFEDDSATESVKDKEDESTVEEAAQDISDSSGADEPPVTEKPVVVKPTIDETGLIDQDGIKITAKSLKEINKDNIEMILFVENNSDEEISFYIDDCLINDCAMCSASIGQNVLSGKSANAKMSINTSYIKRFGIEKIGDIKITIEVRDQNYNTIIRGDLLDIPTSLHDQMDTHMNLEGGQMIYDGKYITVIGKYTENSPWYCKKGVILFVNNKSNNNIRLNCDSLSVNNYMMEYTGFENDAIYGGAKAICFCGFRDASLRENGIDDVENISFDLEVFDDNYDVLEKTDNITITVN